MRVRWMKNENIHLRANFSAFAQQPALGYNLVRWQPISQNKSPIFFPLVARRSGTSFARFRYERTLAPAFPSPRQENSERHVTDALRPSLLKTKPMPVETPGTPGNWYVHRKLAQITTPAIYRAIPPKTITKPGSSGKLTADGRLLIAHVFPRNANRRRGPAVAAAPPCAVTVMEMRRIRHPRGRLKHAPRTLSGNGSSM